MLENIFVAILLFKFLRPRPLVRFSSCCTLADGVLTIRMLRESRYQLSDCRLAVQCRCLKQRGGAEGLLSADLLPLPLASSTTQQLDVWEVQHQVSESSPLHSSLVLGILQRKVLEVDVTLTVFDTGTPQPSGGSDASSGEATRPRGKRRQHANGTGGDALWGGKRWQHVVGLMCAGLTQDGVCMLGDSRCAAYNTEVTYLSCLRPRPQG